MNAEPLRILIVSRGVLAQRVRVFEELCNQFDCRVHIASFESKEPSRHPHVTQTHLGGKMRKMSLFYTRGCPIAHLDFRIVALIEKHRPHVIIASGFGSGTTLLAQWWGRLRGIPSIVWNENPTRDDTLDHTSIRLLKRHMARLCASCWATSTDAAEVLRRFGVPGERIFVVPYVVDATHFAVGAAYWREHKAEVKAELGIPAHHKIVIQVGAISARKGVVEMIFAMEEILRRTECTFLFIGQGPLENFFHAECERRGLSPYVRHLRSVPNAALPKYYGISDLSVLASQGDVWALVVNEAAAAGLPLVLTDEVDARLALLENGRNGVVVPIEVDEALCYRNAQGRLERGEDVPVRPAYDYLKLADAITELLADDEKLQRMGRRSAEIGGAFDHTVALQQIYRSFGELGLALQPRREPKTESMIPIP